MNLNGKAVSISAIISFATSIANTYFATTPHPTSWLELLRIEFVMSWIVSLSGVTLAAHMNFRDPNSRTRGMDSREPTDIRDLLKRSEK